MKQQLPFQPSQLENYMDAVWFEGYFTAEEVKVLSAMYDSRSKKEAEVTGDAVVEPEFRKSTVAFIEPGEDEINQTLLKLGNLAIQVNSQRYRFDLMGFYEPIQIAEYGIDDFFEWHADYGNQGASIRKLSISIQLSDPSEYEGGDLQFLVHKDGVNAPRTLGTVVIFPSFVLHRVTPITHGVRRSLVGWVSGLPYR